MFFNFIKNNLFTIWRLFSEKSNNSLSEGSIIGDFFLY